MAFNFGSSSSGGGSGGGGGGGGGGLFGSNNNKSNLFGTSVGANGSAFSFGAKPAPTPGSEGQNAATSASTDSQSAPSNVFSGFGTPDRSSTSSPATTSAAPLFGSTTPAASKPFSFGPSTTPAGQPPSMLGLGASTGGSSSSLFAPKAAGDIPKMGSGFSFGKPAEAPPPAESRPSGFSFGPSAGQTASKSVEQKAPAPAFGGFGGASAQPALKPAETTSNVAPQEQKPLFSFTPSTPAATPQQTSSQPAAASSFTGFGAPPKPPGGQNLFNQPAATEAPKSPFGFPQPTSSQPQSGSSTPAATAAPKSLFTGMGAAAASSAAQSATTPAPAGSPFSFPTSQPTTTSAPAASPFSFPTTTTAQPAATSTPALSGYSFGKPAAAATSQPASTPAAPASTPFSLGGATTTSGSQPAATATTGAVGSAPFRQSTAGPAPPAQSRLRNKTMDEILTRWATDLSRYSKEFKDHAETIARWDQLIVDNSSKIDKLYVRTRVAERQTTSVDMQLSAVENAQNELESWLTKYENEVDEMLAKDSAAPSEMGGPDQERERTYKLAERLGERLDEMEKDLGSMVEEVNAANASLSKNGKGDEPITQIVKILNSHLIQLQAIDQGTQALQEKIVTAQRSANQLGYLNGGSSMSGNRSSATEDFYKSYMRRS